RPGAPPRVKGGVGHPRAEGVADRAGDQHATARLPRQYRKNRSLSHTNYTTAARPAVPVLLDQPHHRPTNGTQPGVRKIERLFSEGEQSTRLWLDHVERPTVY